MKRVRLTVAYDGTNYHGWQVQPNGETIEGILNRCLSELLGEKIEVTGASRTDSGVHAMGNVAVFDTDSPIPADKISYALNRRLPEDIRIQKSEEVDGQFHPRHCASRKTYEYRIYCAPFPLPTKRFYSHYTYIPLNIDLMNQAARYLVGTHDFKSFCSTEAQVETTVRQVDCVEVWEEYDRNKGTTMEGQTEENFRPAEEKAADSSMGIHCETAQDRKSEGRKAEDRKNDRGMHREPGREIVIRVSGRGFLYNMVRIIAGTLMDVGRGHIPPQKMQEILEARDRQAAGPTAPACGLTLMQIEYLDYA